MLSTSVVNFLMFKPHLLHSLLMFSTSVVKLQRNRVRSTGSWFKVLPAKTQF